MAKYRKWEHERSKLRHESARYVIKYIFWGVLGCSFSWTLYKIFEAMAGKKTDANIVLDFLGGPQVTVAFSMLAPLLAIAYGGLQRKLRKDTTEKLSKHIQTLELRVDPARTSSTLTARGNTREIDKI